jgi:hypothetical protein
MAAISKIVVEAAGVVETVSRLSFSPVSDRILFGTRLYGNSEGIGEVELDSASCLLRSPKQKKRRDPSSMAMIRRGVCSTSGASRLVGCGSRPYIV